MKKSSKTGKTGYDWNFMMLDEEEDWFDRELDLDAVVHRASCYAVLELFDYLSRRQKLKELKRKLIKSVAMLGISVTSLVTVLSIFFGWWI